MMDLAMNFDTDECLVTAMFDKGNRMIRWKHRQYHSISERGCGYDRAGLQYYKKAVLHE